MPKQAATLPLSLAAPRADRNLYRWLYEELRSAILAGRLRPGSRLPATRDLAETYRISRPTVVTAFEQLKSEGYVEGRAGSGTYVSQVLPDHLLEVGRVRQEKKLPHRPVPLSSYARRLQPFLPPSSTRPIRAFRANLAALDLFPTTLWAQVAARRLRRVSTHLLAGGEALGYRPLREAVAEYLNTSRGVKCSAEQVLIVSGAQEALDRTARVLLNPGEPVWMEEPGYPGAAVVFHAAGAKICPVPVDEEGLDWERGLRRHSRARLVYVTPAHQFPLGVTMSLRRRLALLEWARRSGTLIFEDDYDSEYRYSARPIPALQGLDPSGVVIFAGSFSAVLFPALRLGYLVVPAEMVDVFAAAESVSTHHPPLLEQAVLCDFISEGHFARHIRRMRELYAERLAVLLDGAREKLSGLLEISHVEAGLETVGWLQDSISEERAARAAAERDVEVAPLSRYASGRARKNALVLGFAAVDAKEIRRGVGELATILEAMRRT
ncbi:MAG: PLP-dependent aminotransferase family protein [Acidobacteria bacterium]|nr:MAG: PLP-dependent aminotransferase family protein [Acidobacteriota bacterium]PYY06182.1 MAG: PLP-dependent aminotransferase family protein [Acidobacteriota bacterium]